MFEHNRDPNKINIIKLSLLYFTVKYLFDIYIFEKCEKRLMFTNITYILSELTSLYKLSSVKLKEFE